MFFIFIFNISYLANLCVCIGLYDAWNFHIMDLLIFQVNQKFFLALLAKLGHRTRLAENGIVYFSFTSETRPSHTISRKRYSSLRIYL